MSANLDGDLLVLLTNVARHMRTCADQMVRARRMTRAQLLVLARLERQPDLSQNELAALAEVAPMTIARLVDRLEDFGLVERRTDPKDRRIWRLRLTPAAAPVVREFKRFGAELHGFATKGIEPAILDAMTIGLRQMKKNVSGRRPPETAGTERRGKARP